MSEIILMFGWKKKSNIHWLWCLGQKISPPYISQAEWERKEEREERDLERKKEQKERESPSLSPMSIAIVEMDTEIGESVLFPPALALQDLLFPPNRARERERKSLCTTNHFTKVQQPFCTKCPLVFLFYFFVQGLSQPSLTKSAERNEGLARHS